MTKQEHIRHIRLRIQRHISSIIKACADLSEIEGEMGEPAKLKPADLFVLTNFKKLRKEKASKKSITDLHQLFAAFKPLLNGKENAYDVALQNLKILPGRLL